MQTKSVHIVCLFAFFQKFLTADGDPMSGPKLVVVLQYLNK
jgi:hypothetical protein